MVAILTDYGGQLCYHILLALTTLTLHPLSSLMLSGHQVVSDARRLSDLQWFWSRFPRQTQTVRVQSSEETRRQRGWSFTPGRLPLVQRSWFLEGVGFDLRLPLRCG